jgi:hypothetical protein
MAKKKNNQKPPKSLKTVKKQGRSFCSRFILYSSILVALTVALFSFYVSNGNPSQQVGKLFEMVRRGIAGGSRVNVYDTAYTKVDGNKQFNAYDADVAESYYNFATDFYEYGWGESFHFGWRRVGEPHSRAILNSQIHIAIKLKVGNMDNVVDMGCGIGGPLREIIRLTGANITGVTINQHQVNRGREICSKLSPYMKKRCHFVREDYLAVKNLPENFF